MDKNITIKVVDNNDIESKHFIADMIQEYSWGKSYPMSALEEVLTAEYVVAGYNKNNNLVGCGYVHAHASPDGEDNGNLRMGGAIVHPDYRELGIYSAIYTKRLSYVLENRGNKRIFSCTDNVIIKQYLKSHGWQYLRTTKDDAGDACFVYEYIKE
ncbi:hypothetical protein XF24_00283 [candidate division SR1 bacterium Aalborg_AAW-1]|nr:hypothetical protein XF24_00283 [candidate division SR1 bacterium Aalborg_AAW-1]